MIPRVEISVEHNEDRLRGTLANLMRGDDPATIEFYSAGTGGVERPEAITDAPVGDLLVTAELPDPPGEVADNKLTLADPEDALVLVSGIARWARIKTGEGNPSMDVDCSQFDDVAPLGAIVLQSKTLYAGGGLRIILAEIL